MSDQQTRAQINRDRFVKEIFAEVPRTYELINHVLTLGLDVLWRRRAAKIACQGGGAIWADVCTGTGEMACCLARLAPPETAVYAVDFSKPMMSKAETKPEAQRLTFVTADVKELPFPDDHLDLITISFATRNINLDRGTLVRTFSEFHRVLRPGGRFVNLETSQPPSAIARRLFRLYATLVVKQIGGPVSGSKAGYSYLAHTIPRFYDADELVEIIRSAGFSDVGYRRLLLGLAAIHTAVKA